MSKSVEEEVKRLRYLSQVLDRFMGMHSNAAGSMIRYDEAECDGTCLADDLRNSVSCLEKELSIQQEADAKDAAFGSAVRKMLTAGIYDLSDSPKSFLSNCQRLMQEIDTAMATHTDSEEN
jgi:hypothetical protein